MDLVIDVDMVSIEATKSPTTNVKQTIEINQFPLIFLKVRGSFFYISGQLFPPYSIIIRLILKGRLSLPRIIKREILNILLNIFLKKSKHYKQLNFKIQYS